VGTLCAQKVVDKFVFSQPDGTLAQVQGWGHAWLIFAAYALVVGVLFVLIFKAPKQKEVK
jgi:ABC-type Co2+ transport system permease subunit